MADLNKIRTPKKVVQLPIGEIGGKERSLVYDMNAYALMEEHYGSVETAMETLQDGTIKGVRKLLWYGLIHDEAKYDPDTGDLVSTGITIADVGGWFDMAMLQEFNELITNAFASSLPTQSEQPATDTPSEAAVIVMTPEEMVAYEEEEKIKKY